MAKISALTYILLFALGAKLGFALPPRHDRNDVAFSRHDDRVYYDSKPFNGVQVERYSPSAIFREVQYVEGVREGVAREYSLNQRLIATATYHNGVKEGRELGWYEEGPPHFARNFKGGLLDGVQTEWNLAGGIFKQQRYAAGVESERKIIFESGAVFTNYIRRDDRIYGIDGGALCMQKKPEGEK